MPWQDVHVQIEGPSVVDIHRNFVRRWNAHLKSIPGSPRSYLMSKSWLQKIGAWKRLEGVQPTVGGGAQIQIIRSVSNAHLQQEAYSLDDLDLFSTRREQEGWKSCLQSWRGVHQDNILNAMANCIRSADNYIYIETQFFISNFGKWRSNQGVEVDSSKMGNEDNGINNIIVEALAVRICDHIKARTQFHVYLVIPVHPEGLLSDPAVIQQHRLALLTIKHGSKSLISRIKGLLETFKRDPAEWKNYLTILNMRSYGATVQYARDPITRNEDFGCEIGRFVVTEQIYIHSKLMIVDDAVAIIGSANINDRSLTGNGDSEIAAVIVDTEGVELRDLGSPTMKVQTRKFARELRQQLWMKHFGFLVSSSGPDNTKYFRSFDRAARGGEGLSHLEHPPRLKTTKLDIKRSVKASWDEILERPCAPEVVQAIQLIASKNAEIYECVFQHTPRNKMSQFATVQNCYTLPYPLLFDTKGSNPQKMRLLSRDEIEAAGRDEKFSCVVPPALLPEFMTNLSADEQRALPQNYARALQVYDANRIHNVTKAITHLKKSIVGFFVAAPLDWGMSTEIDGDLSKTSTVDLAYLDTAANSKMG
jgi:phospholipase D1/2